MGGTIGNQRLRPAWHLLTPAKSGQSRLGLRRVRAAFTSDNRMLQAHAYRKHDNRANLRSNLAQEMESGSYPPPHSKALLADFRRHLAARSALDCGVSAPLSLRITEMLHETEGFRLT